MQNHSANLKSDLKYRAYQFSLKVIAFTATFPEKRIYWIIADQLLRAATSIGANIVEAKAASSKRDFIRFFEIALKSANETKYWLALLRDSKLMKRELIEALLVEVGELSNMLGASLLTMKRKR